MTKLTQRQFDCLYGRYKGRTVNELASQYNCTPGTIYFHLARACRALGAIRLVDALIAARHEGLFDRPIYSEDWEITPAQRWYLKAFDEYLKTRSVKARVDMTLMLDHMREETAIRKAAA
ncbi:MAG: hypothetical protein KGL39_57880, partial [Patescibacteria group bacterium]|nr:hypothetical protein [Patescibacteria group bacterium]